MLFRALDIETVPDLRFWTPGEPKWVPRPGARYEFESSLPQYSQRGNAFFEGVRLEGFVHPQSTYCDLTYVKEEPFPPPQAQRVVAVAWCDVEMRVEADKPKVYEFSGLHTKADWSVDPCDPRPERGLVEALREEMVERPATIVTWNGRTFDLPVLAMRALYLGVPWGWYYDERDVRYRYSEAGHCDLMDFLSDYGASRSMKLDDAARLVGLPGKGEPSADRLDGFKIADFVAGSSVVDCAERQLKVARYCLQDAVQTALIFLRTRYHLEILSAEEHALSLATFSGSKIVRKVVDVDWDRCAVGGKK